MKECPRCGSPLSAYSLSDAEAYGCDSCGWVGVPVDHQSEPKRLESWQDAIQRFQKKFAADGLEEHAERLERVEQARRDAVGGEFDDDVAAEDEETAAAEDHESDEADAAPDDAESADTDEATADEADETDAVADDEADGTSEAAADEEADDGVDADDDAGSDADEDVEVAADGAGT